MERIKTLEWTNRDRSEWDESIMVGEVDKKQWADQETGLPCMIRRNSLGAWCGYVGVEEGHPAYLELFDRVDADVHCGLTYSNFCDNDADEASGICHVAEKQVWWLGFDCAHAWDLVPAFKKLNEHHPTTDIYRTQAYVEAECRDLAKQLADMPPRNA